MTVVLGIIIFAVGAIFGALGFKVFAQSSVEQRELASKVEKSESALAQYKVDVSEHLDNSTKLLAQMNNTCQAAMKQMEESTELLQKATPSDAAAMPFFSKETQEQLAETVNLRHNREERKEDVAITEAPLDYSGESTGLFADKTQPVTNTNS